MTERTKAIPLEPGVELGVRCYVQGVLYGKWDRLTDEFGLPKEELLQIADLFHSRQLAFNEWRFHKAEQFEAAGDPRRAEEWRQQRCMLCNEVMFSNTIQNICPCYGRYKIGYTQYNPVDPVMHLQNWQALGGAWGQGGRPAGTAQARAYANRPCYSDQCQECDHTFFVTISEMLKVARALMEDAEAGGDGRYCLRKVCSDCKQQQRANGRRGHGRGVMHLRPASPGPSAQPHVGGERGAKR